VSKIIITSNTLEMGGAERQRVMLANELAARGHRVEIHLLQSRGPLVRQVEPGVQVRRKKWYVPSLVLRRPTTMITGTTNTECAYAYLTRLFTGRRTRWLVAAHTPVAASGPTYGPLLHRLTCRADAIISLSRGQADTLVRADGFRAELMHVVPNGIETNRFAKLIPGRSNASVLQLGFIGRLALQKGLDLLLDALSQTELPFPWRLHVAGQGPAEEDLRRQASRLGLEDHIHWHGTVMAEAFLPEIDVLLVPSRNEAFPLVVLEALAGGVPVVASSVGAIPEILDRGRLGVLVDPNSPAKWHSILAGLPQLISSIDNGAGRAEAFAKYSVTAMVAKYLEVVDVVWRPAEMSRPAPARL
jgi:glycosyltransferase involved in cell wall biosynthesis